MLNAGIHSRGAIVVLHVRIGERKADRASFPPGQASQTVNTKTMIVVMKRELLHQVILPLGDEQEHEGRHRGQEDDQAHQYRGVGQ